MTLEKLRAHRSTILALAAKHGARNLRVFGSVARQQSDEASDVDFLAEFQPDRSLFDWAALVNDLHQLLGVKVDVVSDRGLRERVRENILRDAVPL
jgi:uncharacterized protein